MKTKKLQLGMYTEEEFMELFDLKEKPDVNASGSGEEPGVSSFIVKIKGVEEYLSMVVIYYPCEKFYIVISISRMTREECLQDLLGRLKDKDVCISLIPRAIEIDNTVSLSSTYIDFYYSSVDIVASYDSDENIHTNNNLIGYELRKAFTAEEMSSILRIPIEVLKNATSDTISIRYRTPKNYVEVRVVYRNKIYAWRFDDIKESDKGNSADYVHPNRIKMYVKDRYGDNTIALARIIFE